MKGNIIFKYFFFSIYFYNQHRFRFWFVFMIAKQVAKKKIVSDIWFLLILDSITTTNQILIENV